MHNYALEVHNVCSTNIETSTNKGFEVSLSSSWSGPGLIYFYLFTLSWTGHNSIDFMPQLLILITATWKRTQLHRAHKRAGWMVGRYLSGGQLAPGSFFGLRAAVAYPVPTDCVSQNTEAISCQLRSLDSRVHHLCWCMSKGCLLTAECWDLAKGPLKLHVLLWNKKIFWWGWVTIHRFS